MVTDYVIGFEKGATDVHYRIIASKPNIGRIVSLENTKSTKLLCKFGFKTSSAFSLYAY